MLRVLHLRRPFAACGFAFAWRQAIAKPQAANKENNAWAFSPAA